MKALKKLSKISILLLFILVLAGCGYSKETDNRENVLDMVIAGGSPEGSLQMVLTGISECLHKTEPDAKITIVPGSGTANLYRINNNEVDMGATHNIAAYSAVKGEGIFVEPLDNITAIASLYPSTLQIAANKELGIISFDQIIDEKLLIKISIDQSGSTSAETFKRLLAEYGVNEKEFTEWGGEIVYKNMSDSAYMLADGRIDVMSLSTLFPAPTILEMQTNKDLVLLEINQDVLNRMTEKYHYNITVIPNGTYNFLDHDLPSLSTNTIIAVPKNMPEAAAYEVTRSIGENVDYLHDVHAALKGLTISRMASDVGIPLHPGAEKYYREQGIFQ
ncbi:MAG TPA: TAXI family TRAP transporter solute-binding subunit [Syntrophomonadaceae bacterium]|nr:TAXI family TRAP transporter solute-binding subunit [Syntrophomonadaceae bacterium]